MPFLLLLFPERQCIIPNVLPRIMLEARVTVAKTFAKSGRLIGSKPMRFYAADKAEQKKIVDRLWMDVAEGRVSRKTARKVYVRRKVLSGRRVKSGLADIFGKSVYESLGAVAAVTLCLIAALGFCQMRRSNEALRARNSTLVAEKQALREDIDELNSNIGLLNAAIDRYEQLSEEQKAEIKEKEADILAGKQLIEELKLKHQNDLSAVTEAEEARLQELVDMINDLDIFNDLTSRSGNLYEATREIDAATTTIRRVLGDSELADEVIDHLNSESGKIKYYRNRFPDYFPVDGTSISSSYGWRRDPFTGESKFHKGMDIVCSMNTPVWAAASGTVIEAGENGSYGLNVVIDHGNGIVTRYAHLNKIIVKVGDTVQKSDKIAYSGMSGRATGPHLHFEVIVNGETQNPKYYVGTRA